MMRKPYKPVAEPSKKWLLTFNDMITLLLTFFVLIISMSMTEMGKMAAVVHSVRKIAGGGQVYDRTANSNVQGVVSSLRDEDIERARRQSERGFSDDPFTVKRSAVTGILKNIEGLKVIPTENGLLLSMNENMLFSSGSAEISDHGARVLENISHVINRVDVFIRVEGHTDSIPIHSDKYPSNWELSLARAANVVRWFVKNGMVNPERLSAAGYADAHPRVSNDTEHNRHVNRRVDIVLSFQKA